MFRVAFLMFRSFLVVCRFSSTPFSLVPCFCGTGSSDFEASGRSLTDCGVVGSVCTLSVVTGRLISCIFPVSVLEAVTGLSWGRVAPVVADPSVVLPACFACGFYPHTASDRRSCLLSGLDTGRDTDHIVFDSVCVAICWYGGGSNPGRNPKQSNGIYSFVEKKERRVKNIELHT